MSCVNMRLVESFMRLSMGDCDKIIPVYQRGQGDDYLMKLIQRSKLQIYGQASIILAVCVIGNGSRRAAVPPSRTQNAEQLPYSVFGHQTPLMRQLKDVDMWFQHNKVMNHRLIVRQLDVL